jgi:hypothetical protein
MGRKSGGRYSGWGRYGRAFTPAEFKKSWIKKNFKMSYSEYLKSSGNNSKKRGKSAFK